MPVDPSRIMELANAFYGSSTLFAASDAGVFAALAERGAADAETLAEALALNPRGARLLLDGCVALGLLIKEGATYRNTPEAAACLVPGAAMDLSRAIRYNRDVYDAWGKLPSFVRSGAPVEKPAIHLGDDPERTRAFVLSMHHRAMAIGRAVLPLLQLEGRTRLLDVGGGPGTYAALCAREHPELRATVLDLPAVVAIAEELIAEQGMSERVTTQPGDYHTAAFPEGMDAVHFFGMLHQESPDSIRDLLARAHAALVPGGVVHVMDMMTDASHTQPPFSALFALNMALTTENGWVFSDEELKGWLVEAGFRAVATTPLPKPMPHWLVTARKPVH